MMSCNCKQSCEEVRIFELAASTIICMGIFLYFLETTSHNDFKGCNSRSSTSCRPNFQTKMATNMTTVLGAAHHLGAL